jgi:hypothetical protein
MSVIAKQSGLASIALGIGLMLGAANTMFVLPRAFEGNEAVWGLLRIMTSWGMICSSIFPLGAPPAILRFLSRYPQAEQGKHLKAILLIAGFGIVAGLTMISIWGPAWIAQMSEQDTVLLKNNVGGFTTIIAIMSLMALFRALLTLKLKTGLIAWVDEVWQKGSYLMLGGALLLGYLPLEYFIPAYIASWAISLILLAFPARRTIPSTGDTIDWKQFRPLANFSLFSLFAGGAAIIANQLGLCHDWHVPRPRGSARLHDGVFHWLCGGHAHACHSKDCFGNCCHQNPQQFECRNAKTESKFCSGQLFAHGQYHGRNLGGISTISIASARKI